MKTNWLVLLMSGILFSCSTMLLAADGEASAETARNVELFQAIDDGLVEVKLTPRSSLECKISVENKSGKPLVVDMPAAFAAVPVAQFDGGGMGFGGMGGGGRGGMGGMGGGMNSRNGMGGSGGGNQSFGGGMGGNSRGGMGGGRGGMGGGRGGMGGGGWFVPAEKTVSEKIRTVCLEHGKKEPRSFMKYTIVPIDSYTENKTTQVLCSMLADGSIDQQAVQAAVWNTENGISYDELAAKRDRNPGGPKRPYFSGQQLAWSQQVLQEASNIVAEWEEQERLDAENNADSSEQEEATTEATKTSDDF